MSDKQPPLPSVSVGAGKDVTHDAGGVSPVGFSPGEGIEDSHQFLQTVLGNLGEGIIVLDRDFKVRMINDVLANLLKRSKSEILDKHCYNLIHGRDDICDDCAAIGTFRTGKPGSVCHSGTAKDGSVTYAEISTYPIFNAHGDVVQVIEKAVDISDRKKAEEQIKIFRKFADASGQGLGMASLDKKVSYVNPTLMRLMGEKRPEDCYRKEILAYYPEAVCDRLRTEILPTVMRTGQWIGESEFLSVHGEVIPIMQNIFLIRNDNGTPAFIATVISDIRERKRSENEFRKLMNAVEQMAEMVMITDTDGTIEFVNPAMEVVTGYTREELLGNTPRLLKSGLMSPLFYERMWGTIKAGDTWTAEIVNKKKSGSLFDNKSVISPVFDDTGRITHYAAVMRDITEEKKMRRQLVHADKLSSIGTFVTGIAHELNNPLSAVLGFSQNLFHREDLPPDVKRELGIIADQSKRAAGVVRSLLKYARKQKHERKNVDVNHVLDAMFTARHIPLLAGGVRIEKRFADGLPPVYADADYLQQVFSNIVLNARHAMEETKTVGELTITTEKEGKSVVVAFENNGPAIPVETMEKIFDPFFTTKEVGEGTGLGLYVSYGIIREYDGDIRVENVGPTGVRVTVSLPVAAVLPAMGKPASVVETDALPDGLRILVVEDESTVRMWLSSYLLKRGLFVHAVDNGRDAVRLIEESDMSFDVILSDIKMPEMDGYALGKWLHRHRPQDLSRLVFLTGMIEEKVEKFCEEYHCRYLIKPVDGENILKTIREVLA